MGDTEAILPPDDDQSFFSSRTRLEIAAACRHKRSLSQIAAQMRREEGSIRGVVKRMVEEKVLIEGPPTTSRYKASFYLSPQFAPQLRAAEKAARRKSAPADVEGPAVYSGQRLLLIGGAGLDSLVRALKETPANRDSEWIARVDGDGQRLLLALPDDGLLSDRIEAALHEAVGIVQQFRVDQILSFEELEEWLQDQR